MKSTPQSYPPGSRPGTVFVPQGVLLRGPAFILDTLACSLIAALILGGHASLVKVVLVTLAVEFAYFSAWEGALATTPGKRVFGLRVVRAGDGRPCGPPAALVRTLLRIVDNILFSLPGLVAIVSSPRRQRIGDRVAGTLVVSEVPEQLLQMLGGISALRPEGTPEDGPGDDADGGQTDRPGDHAGDGLMPDQVMRDLAELARRSRARRCASFPAETVRRSTPPVRVLAPRPSKRRSCPAPSVRRRWIPTRSSAGTVATTSTRCRRTARPTTSHLSHCSTRRTATTASTLSGVSSSPPSRRPWTPCAPAVPSWPQDDRLLAVRMFSEVADPRPVAFLDFMADDPDRRRQGTGGRDTAPYVPEPWTGPTASRPVAAGQWRRSLSSIAHRRMASQSRSSCAGSPWSGLAGNAASSLSLRPSRAGS